MKRWLSTLGKLAVILMMLTLFSTMAFAKREMVVQSVRLDDGVEVEWDELDDYAGMEVWCAAYDKHGRIIAIGQADMNGEACRLKCNPQRVAYVKLFLFGEEIKPAEDVKIPGQNYDPQKPVQEQEHLCLWELVEELRPNGYFESGEGKYRCPTCGAEITRGIPAQAEPEERALKDRAEELGLLQYLELEDMGEATRLDLAMLVPIVARIDHYDNILPSATCKFPDCADLSDQEKGVLNAVSGFIPGNENGNLVPYAGMTRAEVAYVLYRCMGFPYPQNLKEYSDVPEGIWYYEAVNVLYSLGILDDSTEFRPTDKATVADLLKWAVNADEWADQMIDRMSPTNLRFENRGQTLSWNGSQSGLWSMWYNVGMQNANTGKWETIGRAYPEDKTDGNYSIPIRWRHAGQYQGVNVCAETEFGRPYGNTKDMDMTMTVRFNEFNPATVTVVEADGGKALKITGMPANRGARVMLSGDGRFDSSNHMTWQQADGNGEMLWKPSRPQDARLLEGEFWYVIEDFSDYNLSGKNLTYTVFFYGEGHIKPDPVAPDTPDDYQELLDKANHAGLLKYIDIADMGEMTRLDAAKLLAALHKTRLDENRQLPYTDCEGLTQLEKDIIASVGRDGLMVGTSGDYAGTFDPYGSVTNVQVLWMVYRAMGLPNGPITGDWVEFTINNVTALGILQAGDPDYRDTATKKSALTWMLRGIEWVENNPPTLDDELIRRAEAAGLLKYIDTTDMGMITRLDAAKLVAAWFDLNVVPTPDCSYTDCDSLTDLEKGIVNMGLKYGAFTLNGGIFSPYSKVTRNEFAVIMMNCLGPIETELVLTYPDVPAWAQPYVYPLYNLGILGDEPNFYGNNYATKADVLQWILNAKDWEQGITLRNLRFSENGKWIYWDADETRVSNLYYMVSFWDDETGSWTPNQGVRVREDEPLGICTRWNTPGSYSAVRVVPRIGNRTLWDCSLINWDMKMSVTRVYFKGANVELIDTVDGKALSISGLPAGEEVRVGIGDDVILYNDGYTQTVEDDGTLIREFEMDWDGPIYYTVESFKYYSISPDGKQVNYHVQCYANGVFKPTPVIPGATAEQQAVLEQANNAGLLEYLDLTDLGDLTRLDTAKLLAAMCNLYMQEDSEPPFVDTDNLTQQEKDIIMTVLDNELMNATGHDTFAPDGNVTNAQVLLMLYRAMGEPNGSVSGSNDLMLFTVKQMTALGILHNGDPSVSAAATKESALTWMLRVKDWMKEHPFGGGSAVPPADDSAYAVQDVWFDMYMGEVPVMYYELPAAISGDPDVRVDLCVPNGNGDWDKVMGSNQGYLWMPWLEPGDYDRFKLMTVMKGTEEIKASVIVEDVNVSIRSGGVSNAQVTFTEIDRGYHWEAVNGQPDTCFSMEIVEEGVGSFRPTGCFDANGFGEGREGGDRAISHIENGTFVLYEYRDLDISSKNLSVTIWETEEKPCLNMDSSYAVTNVRFGFVGDHIALLFDAPQNVAGNVEYELQMIDAATGRYYGRWSDFHRDYNQNYVFLGNYDHGTYEDMVIYTYVDGEVKAEVKLDDYSLNIENLGESNIRADFVFSGDSYNKAYDCTVIGSPNFRFLIEAFDDEGSSCRSGKLDANGNWFDVGAIFRNTDFIEKGYYRAREYDTIRFLNNNTTCKIIYRDSKTWNCLRGYGYVTHDPEQGMTDKGDKVDYITFWNGEENLVIQAKHQFTGLLAKGDFFSYRMEVRDNGELRLGEIVKNDGKVAEVTACGVGMTPEWIELDGMHYDCVEPPVLVYVEDREGIYAEDYRIEVGEKVRYVLNDAGKIAAVYVNLTDSVEDDDVTPSYKTDRFVIVKAIGADAFHAYQFKILRTDGTIETVGIESVNGSLTGSDIVRDTMYTVQDSDDDGKYEFYMPETAVGANGKIAGYDAYVQGVALDARNDRLVNGWKIADDAVVFVHNPQNGDAWSVVTGERLAMSDYAMVNVAYANKQADGFYAVELAVAASTLNYISEVRYGYAVAHPEQVKNAEGAIIDQITFWDGDEYVTMLTHRNGAGLLAKGNFFSYRVNQDDEMTDIEVNMGIVGTVTAVKFSDPKWIALDGIKFNFAEDSTVIYVDTENFTGVYGHEVEIDQTVRCVLNSAGEVTAVFVDVSEKDYPTVSGYVIDLGLNGNQLQMTLNVPANVDPNARYDYWLFNSGDPDTYYVNVDHGAYSIEVIPDGGYYDSYRVTAYDRDLPLDQHIVLGEGKLNKPLCVNDASFSLSGITVTKEAENEDGDAYFSFTGMQPERYTYIFRSNAGGPGYYISGHAAWMTAGFFDQGARIRAAGAVEFGNEFVLEVSEVYEVTLSVSPDEPESNEYAVSNIHFENRNGMYHIVWDAPETTEELIYSISAKKVSTGEWENLSSTTVPLHAMYRELDGQYVGIKIATKINDEVVAEAVNEALSLNVQMVEGSSGVSARFVYNAETGRYDYTITGLDVNASHCKIKLCQYLDKGGSISFSRGINGDGTANGSGSNSKLPQILESGYYRVVEFSDYSMSPDGNSLSYTATYRGDWTSFAAGGETDEPEGDEYAVSNIRFEKIDGGYYLVWDAPEYANNLRYDISAYNIDKNRWEKFVGGYGSNRLSLAHTLAGQNNKGIEIVSYLDDKEVGRSVNNNLSLTIQKVPGTVGAKAAFMYNDQSDQYEYTITGLNPDTASCWISVCQSLDQGKNTFTPSIGGAGKASGGIRRTILPEILANGGYYRITEFSDFVLSADGNSISYTIAAQNDWTAFTVGEASDEPETPEAEKEYALVLNRRVNEDGTVYLRVLKSNGEILTDMEPEQIGSSVSDVQAKTIYCVEDYDADGSFEFYQPSEFNGTMSNWYLTYGEGLNGRRFASDALIFAFTGEDGWQIVTPEEIMDEEYVRLDSGYHKPAADGVSEVHVAFVTYGTLDEVYLLRELGAGVTGDGTVVYTYEALVNCELVEVTTTGPYNVDALYCRAIYDENGCVEKMDYANPSNGHRTSYFNNCTVTYADGVLNVGEGKNLAVSEDAEVNIIILNDEVREALGFADSVIYGISVEETTELLADVQVAQGRYFLQVNAESGTATSVYLNIIRLP